MKKISSLLIIFMVTAFISCEDASQNQSAENDENESSNVELTAEQKAIAGIETGKPQTRLVADAIDCSGYIDVPPTNKSTLHAPIDGIVQSINVVAGRKVSANEVLATLADQEIIQIQEQFLDQQLEEEYWEEELRRKKKLFEQEAISKKEFLNTQIEYRKAKYALLSLAEQLVLLGITEESLAENGISSTISIRAPFDGFVSDVFVNMGMYVDEHIPLVEMINYDHVHLELSVYSSDIAKVELDQPVRFRLTGSEIGGWGTVQLIGKKIDKVNRSVLVHAHIDKYIEELTIGASIMAEILTNTDSVLAIPNDAIVNYGERHFVFVEQEEAFFKQAVETGRSYGGFTELLNPEVLSGNKIVTKGAYYLVD